MVNYWCKCLNVSVDGSDATLTMTTESSDHQRQRLVDDEKMNSLFEYDVTGCRVAHKRLQVINAEKNSGAAVEGNTCLLRPYLEKIEFEFAKDVVKSVYLI
jgi:hypothetical protein